jgi:NAD(P)-dependent dehydrogenase (short-subunit alcohol dehydrogenase family)
MATTASAATSSDLDLSAPLVPTSPAPAPAPLPSGPVVLITGCTDGGIGHALALQFAADGCRVVATSRSLDSMRGLEGESRISLRPLDVRSEKSIQETVDSVMEEFRRIDVLVNNAGVHLVAPLLEAPMDSFDMVFHTNVYGNSFFFFSFFFQISYFLQ